MRLFSRDITAEDSDLHPINANKNLVSHGEAHGHVGGSPEVVGHGSSGRPVHDTPEVEGQVGNGSVGTNVGQRTLVRVLEGQHGSGSSQLSGLGLELSKDVLSLLLVKGVLRLLLEVGDLVVEVLGLSNAVEQVSKVGSLLGGNLGSGCVLGGRTVTKSPDALGTLNNKVLVDKKTSSGALLSRDLGHELSNNRSHSVTGGPHKSSVRHLKGLLSTVTLGLLGSDHILVNRLNHGLGQNGDLLVREGFLGVVNELLGERGQNVGESLDKSNLEIVSDIGDPLSEIVLEEVLELGSELDTGRATSNNDSVQKSLSDLRVLLELGLLNAIHEGSSNLLGVGDLLEEASVLLDTGDTKGGGHGANTDNKIVEGDLLDDLLLGVLRDGGSDGHNSLLVVNLGSISLEVLAFGLLVSNDASDGLHNGSVLNGSGGTRGQ